MAGGTTTRECSSGTRRGRLKMWVALLDEPSEALVDEDVGGMLAHGAVQVEGDGDEDQPAALARRALGV
eukprot:1647698-Prymnesium_polylepis.1